MADHLAGRRLFIGIGVGHYQHLDDLARPAEDAELMADLMAEFGYRIAPFRLGDYSSAHHVREVLGSWCADADLGSDDVLVLYFAGHGVVEDSDRHYLMCWNSDPMSLAATALPTEDLVRLFTKTGLGHLLVVLDTCYGGDGAVDGAQLVLRTVARGLSGSTRVGGVWLLSAARQEAAFDGVFACTVRQVLKQVGVRTGNRQRFLDLTDIVTELNEQFQQSGVPQRAALANGLITGMAPFFGNPGYAPSLPEGDTNLEQQRRLLASRDLDEHFDPRSRGVAYPTEVGAYFYGRDQLRAELVDWLLAPTTDGRPRVVTGSPGCGKSAVLGRIVALSDVAYREREPDAVFGPESRLPLGSVDIAVHARHKGLEQIVAQIAQTTGIAADSSAELLRRLGERARESGRLVVVVDALDEAGSGTAVDTGGRGEPLRIARQFLRPLAEIPSVRLLVGTRRELVESLGPAAKVLDLDDLRYRNNDDIPRYVANVLLAERRQEIPTPYRDQSDLAQLVGQAVADRADGNFLVARMVAHRLRLAEGPIDTTESNWRDQLPRGIGEAFEDDLDRFGPDKDRVKQLLAPLSFAEGQGLPRGPLWRGMAGALADLAFADEDLTWLLDHAGSYLVEAVEGGRSVYRLYHLALAEHLRGASRHDKAEAQRRIVDVLVASVASDWFAAHDYVRRHVATHAAESGQLDDLAVDPGFLLTVEQRALVRAFPAVTSPAGKQARVAYEQVMHHLDESVPIGVRAAYLELSARRCGAHTLADRVRDLGLPMAWRTDWAWWSPSGVHRQLLGHTEAVNSVATGDLDGRPVALTGSNDETAIIWDLLEHRRLGDLRHDHNVTAVALGATREYSIAVTGDSRGTLFVWDISTGRRMGDPLDAHTNAISAIAIALIDERPVIVSASWDGTVRVWDLETHVQRGRPIAGHRGSVYAVAIAYQDGRPILVTGGADNRVRLWDLSMGAELGDAFTGHSQTVRSLSVTRLGNRTAVVSSSVDGTMIAWDLSTGRMLGEPIRIERLGGRSVATGVVNGNAIAVITCRETASIWDLSTQRQFGQPLSGHVGLINAVAVATVERLPVAITASTDSTVRVWDLTAEQPLSGHTDNVRSLDAAVIGGRALAVTGSADATAITWDLDAGAQVGAALVGHEATVSAVALTEAHGTTVVITGSRDTTVRIWDVSDGRPLLPPLCGHTGAILTIRPFDVDNEPLFATGGEDGTVHVWRLLDGTEYREPLLGYNADVTALAVGHYEGDVVVIAAGNGDQQPMLWRLSDSQVLRAGAGYPDNWTLLTVGFIRGRPTALVAAADNTLVLWDIITGAAEGEPLVGHTNAVNVGTFLDHNDHRWAASASYDNSVRLWDTLSRRAAPYPLPGDRYADVALAFVRDSPHVRLLTAVDGLVRQWDARKSHQHGEALTGYDMSIVALLLAEWDGNRHLLSGSADGVIRVHDRRTGQLSGPTVNGHVGSIARLRQMGSGAPIAISVSTDNTLRVWDLRSRRQRTRLDLPSSAGALAVAPRGDGWVALAGVRPVIQVWQLETRTLLAELAGHTDDIYDLAVIGDSEAALALSGGGDSQARLWDLATLRQVGQPWSGHYGDVNRVALANIDGRVTGFTADDDGTIRAWDTATAERLPLSVPDADRYVSALTVGRVHETNVLAVGSAGGQFRLWCLETNRVVAEVNLVASIADITLDEEGQIFLGTGSGAVRLTVDGWR